MTETIVKAIEEPATATLNLPETAGAWGDVFALPNVAIHTHLLPNGKALFWGRRKHPTNDTFESLNESETRAFLLDLSSLTCVPTSNQPTDAEGNPINLFCSSHTFLPDGRLMVTGGHLYDSQGIDCATIYDPWTDHWSAAEPMQGQTKSDPANSFWKNGRWYPTAVTLADGGVFVCSGTHAIAAPAPLPNAPNTSNNSTPEVWQEGPWTQLTPFIEQTDLLNFLFPRFHLATDGRIFMSGPGADSFFFDTSGKGQWQVSSTRSNGPREYAPSVMYDVGKIIFIGGGNDKDTNLPSQLTEQIDLTENSPAWQSSQPMQFRRRQHNATLLPDGTILVTGGTKGALGAGGQGFNDLTAGEPVHTAELWDSKFDQWTIMAAEDIDRCYHSTAILLPDGRVLSAGGGEYQPTNVLAPNAASDSHLNAQIFSPPYLFRNLTRPIIEEVPSQISYSQTFQVATPDMNDVVRASLVRLSSVTHSFNTGQLIYFMKPSAHEFGVMLTAPPDANLCPPGHYLLFLLNAQGVPSIGKFIKMVGQPSAPSRVSVEVVDQVERNRKIAQNENRPAVVVGLTATCPYGLGTCLAGARGALQKLEGVKTVLSGADNKTSVAFLYLDHDGLPDLQKWPTQFANLANGSYTWRGVEMTLSGNVRQKLNGLILEEDANRPSVLLVPLEIGNKVQVEQRNGVRLPLSKEEADAYDRLAADVEKQRNKMIRTVTGPIRSEPLGFVMEVREFS